ncbi:MAG: phosphoribosylformylglycinamidine synthase subunit PurL [Planctomycetota bacterium]|nr:phosphoribosylformylglycinamidine synthase subunit PurL [Planctomycetota bacterium]
MAPTPGAPAPWRIEIFRKTRFDDPEGTHALAAIEALAQQSPKLAGATSVRYGRGFLLPGELSADKVQEIVGELLADPVVDEAATFEPGATPPAPPSGQRMLVARKPGVMDPVAQTLTRSLAQLELIPGESTPLVQTFHVWQIEGDLSEESLTEIGNELFANEVIETLAVGDETLAYGLPSPRPPVGRVEVELLGLDDAGLMELSTGGQLYLNLEEMHCVQEHYKSVGREPSACELETLAQTWSEHCQHKTFRGNIDFDGERIDNLLKSTIAAATHEIDHPFCISVFHDNAGIIEFDKDLEMDLAFKVETHNHPSAIDPYGGAGTGIGGVIRDILGVGMGARPIANTDAFFVGPQDLPAEDVPRGSLPPRRILNGVIAGVRDYGNRMGIPTVSGGVWYDKGYVANPLVYAGTVGLIPRKFAHKTVVPGDIILVVGGRTGRDGIHGATFSSIELDEESEMTSAAAVQIGDPITEKKVAEGLLTARDLGLFRGLTDCGAGGLSSAIGEMAENTGATVHLERVPLKYPGLTPDEIWISEAQERMVLGVPPEKLEECIAVFAAEDVEATPLGEFNDTGRLVLKYEDEVVADMDLEFLHNGTPKPLRKATWTKPDLADPGAPKIEDPKATLLGLLAQPNIASKEWIVRQYDHEVQGHSVIGPMSGRKHDAPSDGTVLQPCPESKKAVALGCAANARYGKLDPQAMAETVIDEAMRNVVATYGDPKKTALLDNFSWGNCDKPEQLGALVLASKGCYAAAKAFGTPFISGKDSLNNEYRVGDTTLSIPPTLYLSSISVVPNVNNVVSMGAKKEGNLILLVGHTRPELGGSELHDLMGLWGGNVPRPDLRYAKATFEKLHGAMKYKQIAACHDLSEGGLAVALSEMCMAGDMGAEIDLSVIDHDDFPEGYDVDTTLLYSESPSRFLIEVEPGKKYHLQSKMSGIAATPIGRFVSGAKGISIKDSLGRPHLKASLDEVREAFQTRP